MVAVRRLRAVDGERLLLAAVACVGGNQRPQQTRTHVISTAEHPFAVISCERSTRLVRIAAPHEALIAD